MFIFYYHIPHLWPIICLAGHGLWLRRKSYGNGLVNSDPFSYDFLLYWFGLYEKSICIFFCMCMFLGWMCMPMYPHRFFPTANLLERSFPKLLLFNNAMCKGSASISKAGRQAANFWWQYFSRDRFGNFFLDWLIDWLTDLLVFHFFACVFYSLQFLKFFRMVFVHCCLCDWHIAGRFRCQMPVVEYEALPISQRPPIFDDTPKGNPRPRTPGYGGRQRSDSLVDRLIMIAKLAGPSVSVRGCS